MDRSAQSEKRVSGSIIRSVLAALIVTTIVSVERGSAQTEGRSLRTWVDTLDIPLCEEKTFDTWGVWIESASTTDTVIGFRLSDSVLAVEFTLRWDTSRVRLLPPYVLDPVGTLVGRFVSKVQAVDTTTGELFVSASTDQSFRPSVGVGIPLFYLKGRVRASDTAVGLPAGGARIQNLTIEGKLGDQATTVRHHPGFVQVVRDTTPEYSGILRVDGVDLDTNRLDTMEVRAENLDGQRVRRLSFGLAVDTADVRFTTVLPLEAGHPWEGVRRQIDRSAGRIDVLYGEDDGEDLPPIGESPLLRWGVERTTDSQFVATVELLEADLNRTSCLGRLIGTGGMIAGARIMPVDTGRNDTTISVVIGHDPARFRGVRSRVAGYLEAEEGVSGLVVFDPLGREIPISPVPMAGLRVYRVENGYSGPIFAVIRYNDGRIERVKQYITSK